jgi:hypothetical protein
LCDLVRIFPFFDPQKIDNSKIRVKTTYLPTYPVSKPDFLIAPCFLVTFSIFWQLFWALKIR